MGHSSDQHLVEQLRANQSEGFQLLYRHSYPAVERYVCQRQGTTEEADDVFQDMLLILLTNIRQPDFRLTASLNTYVFSISKHLWLQHLKQKKKFATTNADEVAEQADEPAGIFATSSPIDLLGAVLSSITARCLALLTALFFQKKSINTFVNETGYANRHTAQNQKYKCLEQARRQGRNILRRTDE